MSPHVPMTAQEWFTVAELAELALPGLPTTKRNIQKMADREGWAIYRDGAGAICSRPRRARGGGMEYHVSLLPEAARSKLSKVRPAKAARLDVAGMQLRFERLPQTMKDKALFRLMTLRRVEDLQRSGATKQDAVEIAVAEAVRQARSDGREVKISVRSVYDWFDLVRGVEAHEWLAFLAPAYSGRQSSTECHPDLWEAYKAAYCQLNKPPHARCYQEMRRLAKANDWTLPHAKYFIRRIAAEIAADEMVYLREGAKALKDTFAYADRDRTGLYPLQVTNLDGHLWDIEVIWPDGSIGRPYSLAIQDIASGMPLGIRFDRTLSHHMVRLALGDTLRDYGLIGRLLMDNGSENQAVELAGQVPRMRGKAVEEEPAGLFKILGIEAVFVTPEHGQAKPVERMFRNWAHNICRSAIFTGAYTGHNVLNKPENRSSKPMPFAQFEQIIRAELEYYRDQTGRKGVGMNGRSFREVYLEGVARVPPRRLSQEQLRLCMLSSGERPMHPKDHAVSILGHRYGCRELSALKRQRVIVRFDPDDLSLPIYVYSKDGRFLAEVPRTMQGDFESVVKARAIARERRKQNKLVAALAASKVRLGIDEYGRQLLAATTDGAGRNPGRRNERRGWRLPRVAQAPKPHSEFTSQADRVLLARFQGGS